MYRAGAHNMAGGWRASLVLACLVNFVNGYEETFTISQLSPKSVADERLQSDVLFQTSQLAFSIEPSVKYDDIELISQDEASDFLSDDHVVLEKSVEPSRGSRSINTDEIPLTNNNEIDNELELHNKRKYYEIVPTKTFDYLSDDEAIMSTGFGDKLDFKFPGEGKRAPKGRALAPTGPKIRPTAVHPLTFATIDHKDQGRQNSEIQNIITGIVKLLNGNVNVQANTQLLNGRPRPMASRINNRGPPRITEIPTVPDYDKPITPPPLPFHPTKIPPPYPFDRPHGVNLPEQIVPPMNNRPGLHRPIPPWQRPRPRPNPHRRPNPGLPIYKPTLIPPPDILEDEKDEIAFNENETHSENNLHHDEIIPVLTLPESTTEIRNVTEETEKEVTTEVTTTSTTTTTEATTSTTTTSKKPEITTEKPTEPTTNKPIERPKTEKPNKPEKDKKKETNTEKDKNKDKYKIDSIEKIKNDTSFIEIEPSLVELPSSTVSSSTPTIGLINHSSMGETSTARDIKTSSINVQPIQTSQAVPHQYRPRPGIVLDDTDFKPHGTRYKPDSPIITADAKIPGYGEIFDVTVSAIQGPGEKGASVHIENVHIHDNEREIIVSPSGDHGFVSIDGKRTYLNLFDTSTSVEIPSKASIAPTRVQHTSHAEPTIGPVLGTGVAIPADDVTIPPPRRHRPPTTYRRPQPTVRIDTCIVGDDSTCDIAQHQKCRTEAGISSCQCRPGYARRVQRDPCRRVVALVLNIKVDRIYDRKVTWDSKLTDRESEPYQQMNYEAVRAIDSAFSMTPFSDDFVSGSVNAIHDGDESSRGVFVNYTILIQETAETLRPSVAGDIQRQLVGVLRRRANNIGASALWVDSPNNSVMGLKDLDECSLPDLNDCHSLALCTNAWGTFKCSCPDTTLDTSSPSAAGRRCVLCAAAHCSERGLCRYAQGKPYCTCSAGYYGASCEVDGEVVGVSVGACLAAALVIALTLAALLSWSRKWSREQKAGAGSPVFNYMAANTMKAPPVGQPPYQLSIEERMQWAQLAEAMAQASHYASTDHIQTMTTRPSSAMFGGYPQLPPVPLPRLGLHGPHSGSLNTPSRANAASHHNLYGYTNHVMGTESTSSESSHVQDRADLLMPRPKSRARSMHNQTGIYYDVDYENEPIYGSKGIPLSTYTVSRGPPFYR